MRRRWGLAALVTALASAGAAFAQADYQVPGATPQAVNLISGFEGFRANPYNDSAGNCTIGYGTLIHMGPCTAGDSSRYPNGVTHDQAQSLLQSRADAAAAAVANDVHVPLTAQQRDALTSFVYNVGAGNFAGSTLLRDLNSGNAAAAEAQFGRWINANGRPSQGLINRRNQERCYFLTGSTTCPGHALDVTAPTRPTASLAAATRATLRAPRHVGAGRRATLRGRGWSHGAVRIRAFVPGASPYRAFVVHARANGAGRFKERFRAPRRILDTLRWELHATQGPRSATAHITIRAR